MEQIGRTINKVMPKLSRITKTDKISIEPISFQELKPGMIVAKGTYPYKPFMVKSVHKVSVGLYQVGVLLVSDDAIGAQQHFSPDKFNDAKYHLVVRDN